MVGCVLCGGESRRMGQDKARLAVDGVPMALRGARALARAGASPVVCIGGDAEALGNLGLDVVPDKWPGEGPLAAVVTALEWAPPDAIVVVLACDVVDPDPDALRTLATTLDATGADLVVPVQDGTRQWLHSAWRRDVVSRLGLAVAAGARAVHRGVQGLDVVEVSGIPAAALRDADQPSDLEARG